MSKILDDRAILFANFIVNKKTTIRKTAQVFGVSKSTVHNDISKRLKYVNYALFVDVQKVLKENFSLKHIRGGEATRQKYLWAMRT